MLVWYLLLRYAVLAKDRPQVKTYICMSTSKKHGLILACFGEQGHPENIMPAIQSKLVPMMIANYAVWPIAHLINFKFVPAQQRILYINCCQARVRSALYQPS